MARGIIYLFIARVAFLLSSYGIHITMAYYLASPKDYGTLAIIISMITIARVFLSTGVPQAASQFIAQDEDNSGSILKSALKVQLMVSAVVFAFYVGGTSVWTSFLNDHTLRGYIIWSSPLIFLLGAQQVYLSYFNGLRLFGKQSIFLTVYAVGRFVMPFILVLMGLSILGVVYGFILAASLPIMLILMTTRFRKSDLRFESRKLFDFGLPLIFLALGIALFLNLDIMMLKHFYPESDVVGYYAGAMNLGKVPYFVFNIFSLAVLPSVAKSFSEGNIERTREQVTKTITYLLLLAAPICAIVVATPGQLLAFIYPDVYAAAARPLGVLMISITAFTVLYTMTSIITGLGKPKSSMWLVLSCIPIQVAAGLLLIPRLGMMGAAYANFSAVFSCMIISGYLVYRHVNAVVQVSRLIKIIISSLVVYAALRFLPEFSLTMLPSVYLGALAVYLTLMFGIGGITFEEIRNIFARLTESKNLFKG